MEQSGFWNWKEFENLFVLQYLDTMENCGTLHMSQGLRTLILYKESVHGARSLIYHGIDLRRITHARTASHVRPAEDFIATSAVYGGDNEAMYT